jgi:two-component system, LuxR family, sensor kinase FixL
MKTLSLSVAERLRRLSPSTISGIGLLYLLAVAFVDYHSPARMGFTLFYLLGCCFVGWGAGKRHALVISLATVAIIVAHDWEGNRTAQREWITLWNIFTRVVVVMAGGWVTAEVTRLSRNLGRLVEERTAALQKSEERYRSLVNNLNVGVFRNESEPGGRFLQANPALARIHGYDSLDEFQRIPVADLYQDPGKRGLYLAELSRRGSVSNYELQLKRRDGTRIIAAVTATVHRGPHGEIEWVDGILEDITERMRLERQILEVADREQARIGQDIHDGVCQQLVSVAFDANSLEQQLSGQRQAEARLARRIADVLDQTITEARQLSHGLFPIRLVSDGLPSALLELARSVQNRFHIQCHSECAGGLNVQKVIATHLYRIAQEAANNAVRHGHAKSIAIGLCCQEGEVQLSIEDDGVGIPEAAQERSSGMGLHIMDYRARSIGGRLSVERRPNGGTRVSCCFPSPKAVVSPA